MGKSNKMNVPDGYYERLADWVAAADVKKRKHIKKLHLNDPTPLTEPIGLESTTFWTVRFSDAEAPYKQRNGLVDIIPEGRVFGMKPDVLTPDGKLLWKHSREKHKLPCEHSIFELDALPPVRKTKETVALLSIMDSGVYYHWMLDVLPRLHMMDLCGIQADKYIINGSKVRPFQYETLAMLGIGREQIIESSPDLHLQAQNLIAPHFTRGIRPKWVCDYLREELMRRQHIRPAGGPRRIFVSRSKAGKRMLLNEDEIFTLLSAYGFEKVILEDLPIAKQIQLFASAEVVAAPHGAGLTNLVFCNPGTKVIELFSPQLVHNCYPILSSLQNLQHYYVIGEGERPPEYVDPHDQSADITVNVHNVMQILEMAGIR